MRVRWKSEVVVGRGCHWVHGRDHNPGDGVERKERSPKEPGFEGHKEEEGMQKEQSERWEKPRDSSVLGARK